jgi:hypothetical protein
MHHDETPDLKFVAEKLKENLEVCWLDDQCATVVTFLE